MKRHYRRRRLRAAVLGLVACAALAAPALAEPGADYPQLSTAKSGDTPADFAQIATVPVPTPKAGDTPVDYPGMPGYSAPAGGIVAAPNTPDGDGFDWPSAAIGAGGAGLLILLSVGGVAVVSRRHVRVAR